MSKAIILTEDQYSRLLNVIDTNSYIFEDYKSDMEAKLKTAAKQATINSTKCPTNYKALTPQEIKNYSSYQIKPWLDTRTMNKNWKVLSNGTVCKIIQTTFGGGGDEIDIHKVVENIRSAMGSVVGIAAQVLIDFIPVAGPVINSGAWSLLLSYDVYMGIANNKWDWFNIIVDIIGILTTGPGAGVAKKMLARFSKYAKGSLKSFLMVIKKADPKSFNYLYGMLKKATSAIGTVTSQMNKIVNVIATKAKNTSFYKYLIQIKNVMARIHKIIHEVEGNILLVGAKTVAKAGEKFGEKYAEHQVVHAGVGKATGHGHGGGHDTPHKGTTHTQKLSKPSPTTIPRYITMNGLKKPNPKFKQTYGYA